MLVLLFRFVGAVLWFISSYLYMERADKISKLTDFDSFLSVERDYSHAELYMTLGAGCFVLSSVWMIVTRMCCGPDKTYILRT